VVPSTPFSIEMVDELYKKQIQKAERYVQDLLIGSKKAIDDRYKEIRDFTVQISQRQSELKKMIEEVNDKMERFENFEPF